MRPGRSSGSRAGYWQTARKGAPGICDGRQGDPTPQPQRLDYRGGCEKRRGRARYAFRQSTKITTRCDASLPYPLIKTPASAGRARTAGKFRCPAYQPSASWSNVYCRRIMLNIIRRWTVTRITRFRALRCEPSIHKNARQCGTSPDGGEVSLSSVPAFGRLVKFLWPLLAGNLLEPLCRLCVAGAARVSGPPAFPPGRRPA